MNGFLALPERTDPSPAVILMHGCAGISGTEIGWATTLKGLGIATFIVDVRFQKHFAKGSTRFARPPGLLSCWLSHQACRRRTSRHAPIRIFHGAADDWTVVGTCKTYVERFQKAGKDAALIEYADAQHSFDNPGIALRRLPSVFSTRNCTFVEESGRIVEAETRGSNFYSTCWLRGASVGYNADAHRKAVSDIETFLGALFGLK